MRRVVLDTNAVLSALLFTSGRLAWLRRAWQTRLTPLVCKETAMELLRVLAYPKFGLSAVEQQDLLSEFLPYAEVVDLPSPWPDLPQCRDDKDQVFLVLAHAAAVRNADAAGGVLPVHGCLAALAFLPDHHAGRAACAGG